MKKWIFIISIFFALNSCSVDSETDRDFVLLPIATIEMPMNYSIGNISRIKIKYKRPTECHIFNGFYSEYENTDLFTKTVAIQAVKLNNSGCQEDESLFEVDLEFKPLVEGVYTFRFWIGKDENGVDQYEIREVEVL